MSAWIEIALDRAIAKLRVVALLVSAWIEIPNCTWRTWASPVALLVSAWIEIFIRARKLARDASRTPRECVD